MSGSKKIDFSKYNAKWLHIKVTLPKEDEEVFEQFKKAHKMSTNNEVMRHCFYHTTKCEEEEKDLKVEPALDLAMEDFLKSRFYRRKYAIFSKNDFINRALLRFIEEARNELNLHNMAFRNSLPEKERLVAHALIEQQYRSNIHGVSLETIVKHLGQGDNTVTEEDIKRILFNFVERQLIVQEKYENTVYYGIPA
ncbi:MAG: hypothetical protein ACFFD4_11885 [Candidatus Odinarchaeota archaeon]